MGKASKKYKLFSADSAAVEQGGKRPCAFFGSPSGCKKGDQCMFSHEIAGGGDDKHNASDGKKMQKAAAVLIKREDPSPGSVVSSESSEEGEVKQLQTKKTKQQQKQKTPPTKRDDHFDDDFPFASPDSVYQTTVAAVNIQAKRNRRAKSLEPPNTTIISDNPPPTKKRKTSIDGDGKSSAADSGKKFNSASLGLPIASFIMPTTAPKKETLEVVEVPKEVTASDASSESNAKPSSQTATATKEKFPLPKSTAAGRKWLEVVKMTRAHPGFQTYYDFVKIKEQHGGHHPWIKAKPFGEWCQDFPQVIALDCEMCETQDPVSGEKDHCALSRISVVDAETKEVLLDSLVKPAWPVTDYRTWINGIEADDLKPVEFTLRHAQAFLMALCSEETVLLGHALYNDLAALRMEHYNMADSSFLFKASDSERAIVSLKDLAMGVLRKEMPTKHDSVNDALTALACLEHFVDSNGQVDTISRTFKNRKSHGTDGNRINYGCLLFVHRIPAHLKEKHISEMFLKFTCIEPVNVDPIELGKTHVHFRSTDHCNLAFDTLAGTAEPDPSTRLQKKVFLRNKSSYIRVRKMAFPDQDDPLFPFVATTKTLSKSTAADREEPASD